MTDTGRPPAAGRLFADLDEDPSWEEERVFDDRRSRRLVFTVLGVATALTIVVLAVGQLGLSRSSGLLDHVVGRLMAQRDGTPIAPSEHRTDAPGDDPASSARGSAGVPPTGTPAAPVSAPKTTAMPATPDSTTAPPLTLPPAPGLPAPAERGNGALTQGSTETPVVVSSTSEERMAAFLVEELGPASAAEKALANAAWYGAGESEHAYWERVADVIKQRQRR